MRVPIYNLVQINRCLLCRRVYWGLVVTWSERHSRFGQVLLIQEFFLIIFYFSSDLFVIFFGRFNQEIIDVNLLEVFRQLALVPFHKFLVSVRVVVYVFHLNFVDKPWDLQELLLSFELFLGFFRFRFLVFLSFLWCLLLGRRRGNFLWILWGYKLVVGLFLFLINFKSIGIVFFARCIYFKPFELYLFLHFFLLVLDFFEPCSDRIHFLFIFLCKAFGRVELLFVLFFSSICLLRLGNGPFAIAIF